MMTAALGTSWHLNELAWGAIVGHAWCSHTPRGKEFWQILRAKALLRNASAMHDHAAGDSARCVVGAFQGAIVNMYLCPNLLQEVPLLHFDALHAQSDIVASYDLPTSQVFGLTSTCWT